jgi:diadenosine tetraphosphate (Ap4A) HIT family hydrolase
MRSYDDYSLSDDAKPCPFCEIDRPLIVESSKKFIVTLARAPYTKDHLLIIPKKHKILFSKLKSKEIKELFSLVKKRDKKLHTMYEDVTFLLRDGYINL